MRLTLFLDHSCDLACSYCYNGPTFRRVMPMEVARAAIDLALAHPLGLAQVGFFGGEPLLHRPLVAAILDEVRVRTGGEALRPERVLTTNAGGLDDATVAWLKAEDVFLGVSIDGTPAAHDACRRFPDGRSSYARTAAGLSRAIAAGLRLKTLSVIDPANVRHLPDSFDHLLDLGVRTLGFNLNYEGAWDDAARSAFEEALERLADRYVAAHRRGIGFRMSLFDAKIVTHLKGGYAFTDRCDFGCAELAVAPSGNLYPCDRLVGADDRPELVIGHVATGVDTARRDALVHRKDRTPDGCAECIHAPRCMTWCGCVNHAMTGDVGEVAGLLCWFERRIIAAADRAAETLFAERNPSFLLRFYPE